MRLTINPVHSRGKLKFAVIFLTTFFTLMGCSENKEASSNADESLPFTLTSTAFENNGRIDIKHTNANKNISIPLAWNKAPKGTESFAVLMWDLHPVANDWVHWAVVDIPAEERALAEGASREDMLPEGSKELKNSFGSRGYGGPQPPSGSGDHEYKTVLYALNVKSLDVPDTKISYADFQKLIEGHVIETAEISGFYENK